MRSGLPMLQYGDADSRELAAADGATTDAQDAVAQGTQSSQQQQNRPATSKASETIAGHKTAAQKRFTSISSSNGGSISSDATRAKDVAMNELSKERQRKAFIGMLKLLEHGARDEHQLQLLAAPMSGEEFLQVAEERALAGKCGNPLCSNPFTWQEPKRKYRAVAGNIHKVEENCYCSKACCSFVQQVAAQLVNPMNRIQPQALEQYLAKPSHRPKQSVAAQGGGVPTMKAVIKERDPMRSICESEEADQHLDQAAQQQQRNNAAATAVEGYILRPPQQQQQQGEQQQQEHGAQQTADSSACLAGGATESTGRSDMDSYLQLFRHHRDQQVQQFSSYSALEVTGQGLAKSQAADAAGMCVPDVATAEAPSALSVEPMMATATSSVLGADILSRQHAAGNKTAPATAAATAETTTAASSLDAKQGNKRVTFAPDVTYSCQADLQHVPKQPVLTFTLHDPDSVSRNGAGGSSGGSSSTSGWVGELQITSQEQDEENRSSNGNVGAAAADTLEAAAAGAVVSHDGDDAAAEGHVNDDADQSGTGANATEEFWLPETWRLWFPSVTGGVGVPVEQLVKTVAHPSKQQQRQQQQRQQQQQRGQFLLQEPEQQHVTMHAGTTAASPVAGSMSYKVQAAFTAGLSAGKATAGSAANISPPAAASSTAANCSSNSSSAGSQPLAAAPKPRKFTPTVRPRRSIVLLDGVPGVELKQRGVTPPTLTGDSSSPQWQRQQQVVQQSAQHKRQKEQHLQQKQQQVEQQMAQQQQQQHGSFAHARDRQQRFSDSESSDDEMLGSGSKFDELGSELSDQDWWDDSLHGGASSRPKQGIANDGIWGLDLVGSDASDDGGSSNTGSDQDDRREAHSGSETKAGEGAAAAAASSALGSVLPFLDTGGVTVHLSEFGLLWNTLHYWVSADTVAYATGYQSSTAASAMSDSSAHEAALNGSSSSAADAGAKAAGEVTPSMVVVQQRAAVANLLAQALPLVVEQLAIKVPVSELNKQLHVLIRTFYMSRPLPALQLHHWQLIVGLMLAALSAWQLPVLRSVFSRRQGAGSQLDVMLKGLGTDMDSFMALLDLFGIDE